MKEIWKKIEGWSGYSVSDLGRIRQEVYIKYKHTKPGILHLKIRNRYPTVSLSGGNGNSKNKPVHQLVLEAFVGPRPKGMISRHLNDIKKDNRLSNLRWGTQKQNIEDAVVNGKDQGWKTYTKEQHAKMHKIINSTMRKNNSFFGANHITADERSKKAKKGAQTKKRNNILFGWPALTPEGRNKACKKLSILAKKRLSLVPKEVISASNKKGWITRRKNMRKL